MIPSRRRSALALLLGSVLLAGAADPASPPKEKKPDAAPEKWLIDLDMTVSARPASVPALKYRLFPSNAERKDGNAVPMYLRLAHERGDARRNEVVMKPDGWNKLPLDKFPRDEVRAFLGGYEYNLRQLHLGARRKTAEWNYALDAGDPIGILLPDMQEMRWQAAILTLEARLAIAEGRFADAIRALEAGFSFSQQVSEGPFLICSLVGIARASHFADCVVELSQRPAAPNLYWALTVIPRPLIDLRKANEFEQNMLKMQFPDLADLDRPRTPEQWDLVLARLRTEVERIRKFDSNSKPAKPGSRPTDPSGKSPDLPAARKYLAEIAKVPADQLEKMSPAEVLTRYISTYYQELRDEVFKVNYLPFPQTRALSAAANERLKAAPDTEAAELARLFLPAVTKVQLAEVRLARKLAALRAIEALRMHAAGSGKLPATLAEVKIVPVPDDPGTGKPFEYKLEGGTATLSSRLAGEPLNSTGLRYRVTLRK
jgi:hypothetical protein